MSGERRCPVWLRTQSCPIGEEVVVLRVLGVDPGTVRCGWGLIESSGSRLVRIDSGVIRPKPKEIAQRLAVIAEALQVVIATHRPETLSLERNFLARNVQSAFRLGEARGAIMAVSASAGLTVAEYAPTTLKKAVTGTGRAEKAQVQAAVSRLFGPGFEPDEDEADALAAATCHALSTGMQSKIDAALASPHHNKTSPAARVAPRR